MNLIDVVLRFVISLLQGRLIRTAPAPTGRGPRQGDRRGAAPALCLWVPGLEMAFFAPAWMERLLWERPHLVFGLRSRSSRRRPACAPRAAEEMSAEPPSQQTPRQNSSGAS